MPDLGEGQIIVSTGYVSVILESWLPPNVPPHLFFHLFCLPLLLNGAAELGSALGSVSGWPGPLWVKYEWRHFSRNKGAFFFLWSPGKQYVHSVAIQGPCLQGSCLI